MSKKISIVNNFAQAILSFCDTEDKISAISAQNFTIFKLFKQNPELIGYFQDPFVLKEEKKVALNEILSVHQLMQEYQDGLNLFIDHNHANRIFDLIQSINFRVLELQKRKLVHIYSPYWIEPGQRERLETALQQKHQAQLVFDYHIDAGIVLGIRVRIDDYIEDYSLKSNLDHLKQLISVADKE